MWVAPGASVSDGLFHVTIIRDFSLPEILRHFPKLYNGKLLQLKRFGPSLRRGSRRGPGSGSFLMSTVSNPVSFL